MFRMPVVILLFALLLSGGPIYGQDTGEQPSPPSVRPQFPSPAGDLGQRRPDEAERKMEREQQKKRNQERQAELKRDTDKLFLLATQLKQAVDKSNENTLSLDVIKKAGEIEKLAKSVRDKMRGGY
ncbi:MAG TPA: hypothetical protein VKT29_08540 [Terriglobales bacterium]|nr:hypothetical protein [Terriglobales bacterium]